ncbi:MAG: hypothetical protein ABL973_07085 [Micropepsaceae bacterium]
MNQSPIPGQNTDPAKSSANRSARHGLIEDWRDAVGILLLLLVAAIAGASVARLWPASEEDNPDSTSDLSTRIASLESKLARGTGAEATMLKERVAKLETRLSGVEQSFAIFGGASPVTGTGAGPAPDLALAPFTNPLLETAKRVDDIGTRLTALEAKTATAPEDIKAARTALDALSGTTTSLTGKVDGVSQRLEKLESSDLLTLARRASLATAIANLTRAAQGSSPFRTEYDVVSALMPGESRLRDLQPYAIAGLPTVGTLISSFGSSADAAMDAENQSKGNTWWTRMWANFSSLVSWRSTNEQAGSSTESRLARAGIRLRAGDLDATVRELSSIRGAAAKPLSPWLAKASSRVRVEAALAALNSQAIEAITGPTDSSEPVPQIPTP